LEGFRSELRSNLREKIIISIIFGNAINGIGKQNQSANPPFGELKNTRQVIRIEIYLVKLAEIFFNWSPKERRYVASVDNRTS